MSFPVKDATKSGRRRLVYDLPNDEGVWHIWTWGPFGVDWTPWRFQWSWTLGRVTHVHGINRRGWYRRRQA